MSNPDQYVCAFRGRRDSYQVPISLAETNRLEAFITDIYATPTVRSLAEILPAPWDEKLQKRHDPRLPFDRVECLWRTTLREWTRHALGRPASQTYALLDVVYSEMAARRARQTQSHLLLYTPYAWEAFTESYSHAPKRILFQYHPHAAFERRILREDAARFPQFSFDVNQRAETGSALTNEQQRRVESVWRHADLTLCASSFTQRTLLEAGSDSNSCVVIPYGVNLPDELAKTQSEHVGDEETAFHALFVGSGVQRKGLHHLLLAWKQARLPSSSHLTLVCRVIDPVLERLAHSTPQTTLRRGVSFDTLLTLYRQSALFAMPSLIEGFGQVYLEALSQGCPVLGTSHSCLPDIGKEEDGVFMTEPGDVEMLANRLEELATVLPKDQSFRARARKRARSFSWDRFRTQLSDAVR